MGWLVPGRASQQALNRWGTQVILRVQRAEEKPASETNLSPRQTAGVTNSPPPIVNKELSYRRSMNQKLGRGVGGEKEWVKKKRSRLKRVCMEDLREPQRLDCLYRAAVKSGIVRESPASRLQWFAAAEHATEAGERNPCGLFVAVYRRGLWHHITQAQEELARVKLKRLEFGEDSWLPGMGAGLTF